MTVYINGVADIGGYVQGAEVDNSTAQTIADSSQTTLTWNTELWDTDGIHNGTNPTRLTCKTAGKYLVWCNVLWESNATGYREIFLDKNGGSGNEPYCRVNAINGVENAHVCMAIFDLGVNDYVEARVKQTSGGNLLVSTVSCFGMQRIG